MEYLFSNVEEGTTNMLWPQLQIERNQKKKKYTALGDNIVFYYLIAFTIQFNLVAHCIVSRTQMPLVYCV